MVRKNAKSVWIQYTQGICLQCGANFHVGEQILSGKYCNNCGKLKVKELTLVKNQEVLWYEYRTLCVECGSTFTLGDQILFGIRCKKCGKKWEKTKIILRPRLKKARGL